MKESTPPAQTATAVSPMSRRAGLTNLHLAVLLFGFAALFGKWIALAPPLIVFGRTAVAAAALAALLVAQRKSIGAFDWRLPASGAVLAVHWLTFFQAVQVSTVATALLGFASFPLFIVILETITGGPRPRKATVAAAIAVTVGLSFVVPDASADRNMLAGLLWGLLSGFTFALLAIVNRALTARRDASAIACWQNSCAALCTLPLVIAYPAWPSPRDIGLIIVLGVVCTAAAHTMFIRSMKVVTAHTAGTVTALEPVYGIVLAACLIGEIPPARTLVGAAIIVGTSVVVSMRGGR